MATSGKHYTEVRKILKEHGCFDRKGQLRKWEGKKVVPAMEAEGHSSLGFETCKCRNNSGL
jgi:hypothetical protein